MQILAFIGLSVLAVASGLVVITHRNPVMSALALALNLITIAGFYLLLDAQFVAFLQVILYAGAILVLILFVVMLLNLREEARTHSSGSIQRWLAPALSAVFAVVLGRALTAGGGGRFAAVDPGYGTAASVGREIFGRFFYPFEALSLLLVAAMVGAVLLAKRRL